MAFSIPEPVCSVDRNEATMLGWEYSAIDGTYTIYIQGQFYFILFFCMVLTMLVYVRQRVKVMQSDTIGKKCGKINCYVIKSSKSSHGTQMVLHLIDWYTIQLSRAIISTAPFIWSDRMSYQTEAKRSDMRIQHSAPKSRAGKKSKFLATN